MLVAAASSERFRGSRRAWFSASVDLVERHDDVAADGNTLPVVAGFRLERLAQRVGARLSGLKRTEIGVEADVGLHLLAVVDDAGPEVLPVRTGQRRAGGVAGGAIGQRDRCCHRAGVLDHELTIHVPTGDEVREVEIERAAHVTRRTELNAQRAGVRRGVSVVAGAVVRERRLDGQCHHSHHGDTDQGVADGTLRLRVGHVSPSLLRPHLRLNENCLAGY